MNEKRWQADTFYDVWWLLYQCIIKTALLDLCVQCPGQLLQTVSSSFHRAGLLIRQPLFYDFTMADPWLFAQSLKHASRTANMASSFTLSSAAHRIMGFNFQWINHSLWSFWLLTWHCKILLCDYDPFIVIVVEGFRSFIALLCEWDLFKWLKMLSFFRTFGF